MTKKERNKIYKQALKNISHGEFWFGNGFCTHASQILFGTPNRFEEITPDMFPEFWLFKRKRCGLYWFGHMNYDGNEIRQMALKLCIEMTK